MKGAFTAKSMASRSRRGRLALVIPISLSAVLAAAPVRASPIAVLSENSGARSDQAWINERTGGAARQIPNILRTLIPSIDTAAGIERIVGPLVPSDDQAAFTLQWNDSAGTPMRRWLRRDQQWSDSYRHATLAAAGSDEAVDAALRGFRGEAQQLLGTSAGFRLDQFGLGENPFDPGAAPVGRAGDADDSLLGLGQLIVLHVLDDGQSAEDPDALRHVGLNLMNSVMNVPGVGRAAEVLAELLLNRSRSGARIETDDVGNVVFGEDKGGLGNTASRVKMDYGGQASTWAATVERTVKLAETRPRQKRARKRISMRGFVRQVAFDILGNPISYVLGIGFILVGLAFRRGPKRRIY